MPATNVSITVDKLRIFCPSSMVMAVSMPLVLPHRRPSTEFPADREATRPGADTP